MLFIALTSCLSNKRITYLQNISEGTSYNLDEFIPYSNEEISPYQLQTYDIVDIDFSAFHDELTKVFEFQGSRNLKSRQGGNISAGDVLYFSGYTIDSKGEIELPQIGKVKLEGLTEEEAKNHIQQLINQYFKEEVYVRLKLGGIRFTTIGEFKDPGIKNILKSRATIFEALALSGDANLLADRRNLFLIRQYPGGTKIHQININDRALLASPYYFIQPNDVLYLEPLKRRQIGKTENLSASLGTLFSITSSIVFLTLLFLRN